MTQQRESWEAARRLLRRVRDVMAAPGSMQDRLDFVVRIIAAEMVAEVCSIYIRRGGDMLVLYATQGLNPEAVRVTRLAIGEGLVGHIAERALPIALSEAQSHPDFAYRPETGEEIYHSLMGVPILRAGRVLGVLVVQNRTPRQYTEDEIETLQTVAMVVAELVAGRDIFGDGAAETSAETSTRPKRLSGTPLCGGLAIGTAVLHEPRLPVRRMVAEDPEAEFERLAVALREMYSALDSMFSAADLSSSGEHRDVLDTYRMFAQDRGWIERIREAISGGLTAEAAVRKVQDDTRARMRQVRDPYFRERLHDIDDLSNRLLQHLADPEADQSIASQLPEGAVLVARSMGPAELLDYSRKNLQAVILEQGSPTAHVAIVARALDIPVIGGIDDALGNIQPGDTVIVDGDHGIVFIRPGEQIQQAFVESVRAREEQRAIYAAQKDEPTVTLDGVRIVLNINAGLFIDLQHLHDSAAAGVGLYRTEVPFMVEDRLPDVAAQTEFYQRVLDLVGDRPVVFRTLDLGGDKILPYWRTTREANPAMGWRAIRVALDRPYLLHQQLRALLRASAGRDLNVMFPMVTEVAEFERARSILATEIRRRERRGAELPRRLRVGAMLEVPSLAWQLPALLQRVDFLSVGSNDLLQFFLAADRTNPRLAQRYDVLSPAVLSFLRFVVSKCDEAGVPVSCCGEMAGDPIEALALLGLGFRSISMPPPAVGRIHAMVRSTSVSSLAEYIRSLERLPDHSVRAKLKAYAADHGIAA